MGYYWFREGTGENYVGNGQVRCIYFGTYMTDFATLLPNAPVKLCVV